MKKLSFLILLVISLGLLISSCSSPESKIVPEVEGGINTTASTDNFADLGNKVWIDTNKDGIKQRPESGFSGIAVNLYKDANKDGKPDGNIFKTATTDKGGYYRFNAINPDINYVLEVIAPYGYKFSANNAESSPAKNDFDSDIIPSTGFTKTIDVKKGRYFYWYDAALQLIGPDTNVDVARVGDKIWLDTNKDGIKQGPESGLSGISLNLWLDSNNDNKADKKIASTKTNSAGNYSFENLNPALNYYVEIELPSGYIISKKHNPNANGKDWDNDFNSNGFTDKLELTAGKFNYWLADVGIYKDNSPTKTIDIASYAWIDYNQDGIRQASEESGSLGFVLNLWQDSSNDGKPDKKIATTKTSFRGYYQFTKLDRNASYFVEIELPNGYSLAQKHNPAAANTKLDSDFNTNNHFTDKLIFPNLDFIEGLAGAALIKPATPTAKQAAIGDMVWGDFDKDGIHDDWERGVPDITVNLYIDANKDGKADYQQAFKTQVSYRGYYSFKKLDPSINYIVEVILPDNYAFGPMHNPAAGNKDRDSDIDPNTGRTKSISLKEGVNHYWIDASIIAKTDPSVCKDPVNVPDAVLKQALEDDLGTITCAKLAGLKTFDYSGQGANVAKIKDLTALRFAKNLEILRLDRNDIVDISELKYLTKLQSLDLQLNKIVQIDALKNLSELSSLEIQYNNIVNIDAIANLSKLYRLKLYSNKIANVSKSLNLPKVTQLTFGQNNLHDISGLSGLVNVNRLGLHSNKITDISVLSNMPKITQLYLSDNPNLTDISPLRKLKGLTLLYLDNLTPSDISVLADTNLLETISMKNTGLSDISIFEQLTELHLVMIQKNMITDISPIVSIEGIDGGIVRISENCLDISGGQDLADINNLKARGVTVNYSPQKNCN